MGTHCAAFKTVWDASQRLPHRTDLNQIKDIQIKRKLMKMESSEEKQASKNINKPALKIVML
jgi:hypothetical protein